MRNVSSLGILETACGGGGARERGLNGGRLLVMRIARKFMVVID